MTSSGSASRIVMSWSYGSHEAVLDADLAAGSVQVTWTENGARRRAPLGSLP